MTGKRMRVMTYNIRHGLGNNLHDAGDFGDVDLERVAEVIRQAGPDIVALQEVDRFNPRSCSVDQPVALGKMLGMESCYGANVIYEAGQYGVAILSRYPIVSFSNTPLPTTEGWELRGVLEATVRIPDIGNVQIFNTHLQVGHEETGAQAVKERREQAAVVADRILAVDGPVVLMGDFNAQPGDPELEAFTFLGDAWSIAGDGGPGYTIPSHPASSPNVRIDIIYVDDAFQVKSARVMSDEPAGYASDHLPVVADLDITRSRTA